MPREYKADREELAVVLGRELPDWSPHRVAQLVARLIRIGRRCKRVAVANCNGDIETAEWERLGVSLCNQAASALEDTGIVALIGGDPRGYTLKLMLPSGSHNTWGEKERGWGVVGS